MSKIDISVIIPMYNAKKYIFSCVENILKAEEYGLSLEVIIVNDCSKDDAMDILMERYSGDERVVLINQEKNAGPGKARNRGIEEARGEYITFVDSDDGLRTDAYDKMLKTARAMDADVVHVTGGLMPVTSDIPDDINLLTEDDVYHFTMDQGEKIAEETLLTSDIAKRIELWLNHGLHWAIWNKLYRREFIISHNLKFSDMKLAEDQSFCFGCLVNADKYVILPGEWYIYRISGDSLSRGKKSPEFMIKVLESEALIWDTIYSYVKDNEFAQSNLKLVREAAAYIIKCVDDGFAVPTVRDVGLDALKECESVNNAFAEFFGNNAELMKWQFYKAHEKVLDEETFFEKSNNPLFWKAIKEKRG